MTPYRIRLATFIGAGILLTALPCPASATLIASLNNEGSTTEHEITLYPGDTFRVDVNISTNEQVASVIVGMQASTSGILNCLGGTSEDPWIVPEEHPFPQGPLAPTLEPFLVYTPPGTTFGPGSSKLATLTLEAVSGGPLGDYDLALVYIYYTNKYPTIIEPQSGDPGPNFIIHIVPEPLGLFLLLSGLAVFSKQVPRRRDLSERWRASERRHRYQESR